MRPGKQGQFSSRGKLWYWNSESLALAAEGRWLATTYVRMQNRVAKTKKSISTRIPEDLGTVHDGGVNAADHTAFFLNNAVPNPDMVNT